MSDEALLRLVVVAAITAIALFGAFFLRRGSSVRRYRVRFDDLGPGLYLFTSITCATCARVRERVAHRGDVIEVTFEGDGFPDTIRRVPALALVDERGEGWIAYGAISERRIGRWIADGP